MGGINCPPFDLEQLCSEQLGARCLVEFLYQQINQTLLLIVIECDFQM